MTSRSSKIFFRIEKIDLDGFPASPESKIGISVSYGGKVHDHVEIVKTKEIGTLNLKWSFDIETSYEQILTITVYKSRIMKKSSIIGGLVINLAVLQPNMIYHRIYKMIPVDGIAEPEITYTIHIDEQGSGPFTGVEEPQLAPPEVVEEELSRAEAKLEEELRQRKEN